MSQVKLIFLLQNSDFVLFQFIFLQLNSHISLENRRTVMIQVSTDSYFHNGQLCFYNVSGKIDISAPI